MKILADIVFKTDDAFIDNLFNIPVLDYLDKIINSGMQRWVYCNFIKDKSNETNRRLFEERYNSSCDD